MNELGLFLCRGSALAGAWHFLGTRETPPNPNGYCSESLALKLRLRTTQQSGARPLLPSVSSLLLFDVDQLLRPRPAVTMILRATGRNVSHPRIAGPGQTNGHGYD